MSEAIETETHLIGLHLHELKQFRRFKKLAIQSFFQLYLNNCLKFDV